MGLHLDCPKCGNRMQLDIASGKVVCKHCGYAPLDDESDIEQTRAAIKAQGVHQSKIQRRTEDINPSALAAFDTGEDAAFRGNKAEAIEAFERALALEPEFPEAHLWLAELSDDPAVKRDHITTVLAYNPHNLDAMRELMVLDGRLTPQQAAQTYHDQDQKVLKPIAPITAQADAMHCPNCGGDLTLNEAQGRVECRFCGYTGILNNQPGATRNDNLTMALLARKAQPVRWDVGQRILYCKDCGAETVLSSSEMTTHCRFCGSSEVLTQDALKSFNQPDGVIPFHVIRDAAAAKIKEQLEAESHSLGGQIVHLFNADSHKVVKGTLEGAYIPYWVFDATYDVIQVTTIEGAEVQRDTSTDFLNSVFVCGVKSPPPNLTMRLNYNLSGMMAYRPELLAKYPAQLYSIDFDKASMEVLTVISKHAHEKYQTIVPINEWIEDTNRSERRKTSISTSVQQMQFQLVLAPMWIATLTEADGDMRTILMNGQSGEIVMGKAQKR